MTDREPQLAVAPVEGEAVAQRNVLEQRIAELERELAQMHGREQSWRAERKRLLAALEAAEREVAELPALRHEAQAARDAAYWLSVIQSSWSWRLTGPLRAMTRLRRRRPR